MSNITNKIVWQTADTEKSFVYALHPTLNCNMFSFQVQPGYRIGDDGKPTVTRKAECGEVARRLVACWKACEGLSTENLEDNRPIKELATNYNTVIRQRDQMLKALQAAVECGMVPKSSAREGGAMAHVRQAQVADMIRDAIAACQPAPTVVHLPADDTEGGAL